MDAATSTKYFCFTRVKLEFPGLIVDSYEYIYLCHQTDAGCYISNYRYTTDYTLF